MYKYIQDRDIKLYFDIKIQYMSQIQDKHKETYTFIINHKINYKNT